MATDQTVSARHVLRSLSQVKRQGLHKAMAALEQVEPDLAGYLMEELSLVHQKLFHLGAAPKRTRWLVCRTEALVLVCVDALRRAHGELWTSLSELPAEPADRGRAPNPRANDASDPTDSVADDEADDAST